MTEPATNSASRSIGRTIVAVAILLVVGYFLLHVLIGVAVAIAGFAVVIPGGGCHHLGARPLLAVHPVVCPHTRRWPI